MKTEPNPAFAGLDLLSTAVLIVDHALILHYANPAAENLFAFSLKSALFSRLEKFLPRNMHLFDMLAQAINTRTGVNEGELALDVHGVGVLHLACVATPVEFAEPLLAIEFRQLNQQLKIAREEKILAHQQLNRELIRNLAHEIKNPLGGIRGSAQLLERELPSVDLKEYTQVIVKEADRLQSLMDRMLTPSRLPQMANTNIHEVLERVRVLIVAEFPMGIEIVRDYDASLPDLYADMEQLIQSFLNVIRNAAQAMKGKGQITLVTRIERQLNLARHRYRHVIAVHVIDNGPGVPAALQDTVFYPLVSGREGGTGLGLSLAQNFINQHHGIIEFESVPGNTRFTILLPLQE